MIIAHVYEQRGYILYGEGGLQVNQRSISYSNLFEMQLSNPSPTGNIQLAEFSRNLFDLGEIAVAKQLAHIQTLALQSKTVSQQFQFKIHKQEPEHPHSTQKERTATKVHKERVNRDPSGKERTKISKNTLSECFAAITECYQTIIQVFDAVFIKLAKLSEHTNQGILSKIIYSKTVLRGLESIQRIANLSGNLNKDYENLNSASKDLTAAVLTFRKQLNLEQSFAELPTQSRIFRVRYSEA